MSKNVINNPSGRKRLPEDEKFLPPISVRYTAKQMKRLERKAKKQGVSLSEHIREGSLKCIVRARVTKSLMKEVHDLNNFGNNIHAIAKAAIKEGLTDIADECRVILKEVNSVIHKCRLAIKEKEPEDDELLQG